MLKNIQTWLEWHLPIHFKNLLPKYAKFSSNKCHIQENCNFKNVIEIWNLNKLITLNYIFNKKLLLKFSNDTIRLHLSEIAGKFVHQFLIVPPKHSFM